MTLQEFVDGIKGDSQVGQIGDNTDRAAADIIQKANAGMFKVWRFGAWDWSGQDLSFTLPANSSDYTFGATVGEVVILGKPGKQMVIEKITPRRYREWVLNTTGTSVNDPRWYMPIGRDSSNNLKVRFVNTPSADVTIEGWAKNRLTKFAVADISTTAVFPYFPEEMVDVIYDYVLGAVLFAAKDARGPAMLSEFKSELKRLWGLVATSQDEQPTTPPPDLMIFKARKRGGTQTA